VTDAAARSWADQLAAWAIPDEILRAAPESPWGHPPVLFGAPHPQSMVDTPSRQRALERLPDDASVLDVGCGGGAASLALVPPATRLIGVDQNEGMLTMFASAADERGVEHREVHGDWPATHSEVDVADLVVCHHVAYNVAGLGAFVAALAAATRGRVVMELTGAHPQVTMAPLWRHFWDLDRPDGPTADDAFAVVRELGIDAHIEHWARPPTSRHTDRSEIVAFTRRRLCLTADRDAEVDAAMGNELSFAPRSLATIWWDVET
jgi:SAM-dependent methyltransferase